jgi:cystathionine beta-lyase/cystathionine gamma-synthase
MKSPKRFIAKPVGGYHGITIEFPTLQMNIDYEEKKIRPDRGYPRFVQHPQIRILEEKAREEYHGLSALAFTSAESCLYTIIDCFFNKDVKGIYIDDGLPKNIYSFLVESANKITPQTTKEKAQVAIIKINVNKNQPKKVEGSYRIGFSKGYIKPKDYSSEYDAIIWGHPIESLGVLVLYNEDYEIYDLLRRHTGFILNSRKAQRIIRRKSCPTFEFDPLKKKIATLEKTDGENCLLYPSGMAAIFSSIITCWKPNRPKLIMIGSAYVDTLCILEKWPSRRGTPKAVFIDDTDDIKKLRDEVDLETSAIITEIPTNPLLQVPDLGKIVNIAHKKGAKIIVDNTIATPYNFNPFDYEADIIVHSTTKFLNGLNNHIGGVSLTRDPELLSILKKFQVLTNSFMDPEDGIVLERNLKGFKKRMKIINKNAVKIADYLNQNPKVGKVYYPGLKNHPDHIVAKKYLLNGYSGLMSFVLKNSNRDNASTFYDNLGPPIIKGPSLGAEQTLLCPYTILAHYNDPPEKRKKMGLDLYLFRISIGIERPNNIIASLDKAFKNVI